MIRTRHFAWVLALGLTVALTGCATSEATTDKVGGTGEPVVMTMAGPYSTVSLAPPVLDFARRVETLSAGTIKIEEAPGWGEYQPDAEQQVVRDTAAGEADLGWTGTRVLDTLGVTEFQALTAPMLIDNYPLEMAVLASDIPDHMLPSLDRLGLTGLAVLPGGLRKPIAVEKPLLAPADWNGLTFQVFHSAGEEQAVAALGAATTGIFSHALEDALMSGEVDGFEKSLYILHDNIGLQSLAPYITANVSLWPETIVMFANPDSFASLTDQQQGWLRQAASEAGLGTGDPAMNDQLLLYQLCDGSARAADATEADLDALRQVFTPVYESLQKDAATKDFVARIEDLKSSTPAGPSLTIPSGCTGTAPKSAPAPAPVPTSTELDGTYRWTLTREDALAHGTPADKTSFTLAGFPSTMTATLKDSVWTIESISQTESHSDGPGTFAISGNQTSFTWKSGIVLTFTYTIDADGNLTLTPVLPMEQGDIFVWSTHPWTKIG